MYKYLLYKFLYLFSCGKKHDEFKLKYKKFKQLHKFKKKWDESSNKLFVIDENGNKNQEYFFPGLNINFIGKNTTVIVHHTAVFRKCTMYLSSNHTITIGEQFTNTQNCLISISTGAGTSVQIGNDCMFASNVKILGSDNHPIIDSNNTLVNKADSLAIGNHVWLGENALILKDSIIPDNSIVAAGSVYTRKTYQPKEDEEIIGLNGRVFMGNPAKCVKHGDFTWKR